LDTPRKDNPDDIDTSEERTRVIEVDGVRVVEVTMKPPSAEHLRWLMQNMGEIPPLEQPVIVPPEGAEPGNPRPDGPVGQSQPGDPSGSGKPSAPLPPDPGEPAAAQGLSVPVSEARGAGHVQSGMYSPAEDQARYGRHSDDDDGFPDEAPAAPSGS
jgi:hypothetical protein